MKTRIPVLLLIVLSFSLSSFAKKTKFTCVTYGYKYETVMISSDREPFINKEFHTNPGEEYVVTMDLNAPMVLYVNGKTEIYLEPGDDLKATISYGNNAMNTGLMFNGTPRAVEQNKCIWKFEQDRRAKRYKSQLLSCIVVQVKPEDRIKDSKDLMSQEKKWVEANKSKFSKHFINYMEASTEGRYLYSLIEYPLMAAEFFKLPIEKQNIGDYWKTMDGYKILTNEDAMTSSEYLLFLIYYAKYISNKEAVSNGKEATTTAQFSSLFNAITTVYKDKNMVDLLLYTLLNYQVRQEKNFDNITKLFNLYKEKYNINKKYIEKLSTLMQ